QLAACRVVVEAETVASRRWVDIERGAVPVSVGLEHEHGAGRLVTGQVDVVARRAIAHLLPVAARCAASGGDDDTVLRYEAGEPLSSRRAERCRCEGFLRRGGRVGPAAEEERLELARDRQVVTAGLEFGCRRIGDPPTYPFSHTLVGSQFRSGIQNTQPCTRL